MKRDAGRDRSVSEVELQMRTSVVGVDKPLFRVTKRLACVAHMVAHHEWLLIAYRPDLGAYDIPTQEELIAYSLSGGEECLLKVSNWASGDASEGQRGLRLPFPVLMKE